jgi:integrase
MPRQSKTDNVRKVCGCEKWKTCEHPWYLDYQREKVRYRENLDKLIGRHARDFNEAKDEARRAIVAKLDGRDPKGIIPSDAPTLARLLAEYDHEKPQRDRWQIGRIVATKVAGRAFGEWRIGEITPDALKQFKRARPVVAGNRDLALLRTVFNWAVLGGFLERTPFRIGDVVAVSLTREEARTRRLQPGEEERLLAAAGGLSDLITAALETGCRKGELLSLQWHQVRFSPRAELFLPAGKTKAKRDRRVPISTVLRKVLDARRHDPAGEGIPSDGYVFGDEIGRRRHSVKTAWLLTCKRAKLTDLHFHDLRREAGSRWMDAGIPLATIQRWLGHANISQTSHYLGASLGGDEQDMRLFEERIGRTAPLTLIDVSDGSQRQERPQSDDPPFDKANKDGIEHDPTTVVH